MSNTTSGQNASFCIPVGLTSLQKDLIEILISTHAKSLLQLCENGKYKALENGENDAKLTLPALSPNQLTSLLSTNIRAIANHPCLLVEHYMPRKLLLMEPGERLIDASDKFQKMAALLDSLLYRDRKRFPNALQIAVISHSVKELDLIEGYLLGKSIRLKRLSGTSLFDEKHLYGEPNTGSSTPVMSTGYSKEDNDYRRRKNRVSKKDSRDWLFVATSTHLARAPDLLDGYSIDLVIGFDPLIDENLECFTRMRSAGKKVPLVKLLVKDSPDHYSLVHRQAGNDQDLFLDSLLHFVRNRRAITYQEGTGWLRQFAEELLAESIPNAALIPTCNLTNEYSQMDLSESVTNFPSLSPLLTVNYKLEPVLQDLDIKTYQSVLMDRIVQRLTSCDEEYFAREKEILSKRLQETIRQNKLDELTENAAAVFKQSREEEGPALESAKKLGKAQADDLKLCERLKSLIEQKSSFENKLGDETTPLSSQISALSADLEAAKTERDAQKQANAQRSLTNDDLRVRYQLESSNAANMSMVIKKLRERRDELKARVSGPAVNLFSRSALENEAALKEQLIQIVRQSQFTQGYVKRIQKQFFLNGSHNSVKSASTSRSRRQRN
ncbi:LAFA_0E12860g1_1 [Lachancea sp. 'fantastica']|nr:LAFA_0E12860g1_1 [Lachancea sp. 'fantastica']